MLITGANVHDKWMVAEALDAVALRASRGSRRPENLCLDKGYDYAAPRLPFVRAVSSLIFAGEASSP